MEKKKPGDVMIPVDLRGHETQDDFEMNENFEIIIFKSKKEKFSGNKDDKPQQKDMGDSFLVGELGD